MSMFRLLLPSLPCALSACLYSPDLPADAVGSGGDTSSGSDADGGSATEFPTSGGSTSSGEGDASDGEMTGATSAATCGDGLVQQGEDCDEGLKDTPGCDSDCTLPECGDTHSNSAAGESCDDGVETSGCDADCTLPECGDGHANLITGELCDDGNRDGGDACSVSCQPTEIVEMVPGRSHMCVRFQTGSVRCWGTGGMIGHGDKEARGDDLGELPTQDILAGDGITQMCAGGSHTCVRTESGNLRCWGQGQSGELGYGIDQWVGEARGEMPSSAIDVGIDINQVVCGSNHTCVRTSEDKVRCWGHPVALGYGIASPLGDEAGELPTDDVPGITDVAQIVAGSFHTCALSHNGDLYCWGRNFGGVLGHGTTVHIGDDPGEMPPTPTPLGGEVQQIVSGTDHLCALMLDGNIRCWGKNSEGQLGYDSTEDVGDEPDEMPPKNVNIGGKAKQIAAGDRHTCALMTTGKVRCWGSGFFGQLGYGETDSMGTKPGDMPPDDIELGGDAVAIASRLGYFTCALLIDGALRCWGYNNVGQLGYGHTNTIGDGEKPASVGPVPF